MRKWITALLVLLCLAILGLVTMVALAHRAIDAIDPELPSASALAQAPLDADLPIRLRWINTASQPMPRSGVLEPALDPRPDAEYVMSHPAFVLEWADGRLFLVDLGMTTAAAEQFGAPIEWVSGGQPIEPLQPTAAALGEALPLVRGIGFTHLHVDHVAGISAICDGLQASGGGDNLAVYQTPFQASAGNYTTRGARALIEAASCARPEVLAGDTLYPLPGFPGLSVFTAAGHTPGSQVFIAHVRQEAGVKMVVMTGDVANHIDGILENIPKPSYYSLLVVPESTERLDRVRRLLASLASDHAATLLVAHDQRALEAAGIERW